MKNLTLKNIALAVGGILYNEDFDNGLEIKGVEIDSRKIREGFLFVAIKGERADGHDFASSVFEKGAYCMIAERELEIEGHPYILVRSSHEALRRLAEYYRSGLSVKVVGITGSVGKTSTKEFIASVLSEKYNVLKTAGNFNNEIGLPLTVFNIKEEHETAVLEMGISNFGEMTRLSKIARPDICVITNIGLCHLENLGSRDGILKAKTEIFKYAKEDCPTVLNGDDDKLRSLAPACGGRENKNQVYFYGMGEENQFYAKSIYLKGIFGSECDIVYPQGEFHVNIDVPGKHMIYNTMAATVVGMLMGLNADEIKRGIEKLENVGGRLNIIEENNITIIDDCYNANPVSTKASLDVLVYGSKRKVSILGDMLELGEMEKELHRSVGEYIADKGIEAAVFIGELSRYTYEGLINKGYKGRAFYFESIDLFLKEKDNIIKEGDTVLVKASHSMHFENIVNALKGKNG